MKPKEEKTLNNIASQSDENLGKEPIQNHEKDKSKKEKNRKNKSKANVEKLTGWRKIVAITVPVVCGVIGIAVGFYFGRPYLKPKTDYSNLKIEELEDDVKTNYSRFLKSKDPLKDFKPYELSEIALMKYDLSEHHYYFADGYVNAGPITQHVACIYGRDQDVSFGESLSTSMLVKVAKRFYHNDEAVKTYIGSNIQLTDNLADPKYADWNPNDMTTLTHEEFEKKWGKPLTRTSIYVVSKHTVTESTIKTVDDKYVIDIELDPILGVSRYVTQMNAMSDNDGGRKAEFKRVHLTYTLDKAFNILTRKILEDYTVFIAGMHESTSEVNEKYFFKDFHVPTLDENCHYGG